MVGLGKYTPARVGDRTLVDALGPVVECLGKGGGLREAEREGWRGARGTSGMRASLGRTVYVGSVGDVMDPGAVGVARFVEGLAGAN